MKNILYNELVIRECAVDAGVVYSNERDAKGKLILLQSPAERKPIYSLLMRF